jgi:trehalose-6-phosphate synthase
MVKSIRDIIVEYFSKTPLFEMAYSREQYINNIDNIANQIVENWCLIHYCTLYDSDNENKNHWKQELRAYCKKLLQSIVKVNKLKATNAAMIDMLELDNPDQIYAIIYDKFEEEHFDIKKDICEEFAKIGLQKIIYLVSQNFSNTTYQELYRYIDEDI